MFKLGKLKALGTLAAVLAVAGTAQPAFAQSSRAQIDAEIDRIVRVYRAETVVFGGCALAAATEYYNTGSQNSAIGVLIGCAAIGCALTRDYGNCLNVNTQLFILTYVRR